MTIKTTAIPLVILLLVVPISGCVGQNDQASEQEDPVTDDTPTTIDEIDDPVPTVLDVPNEAGCDSLNPHHCMLPFPSDAYLVEDGSTQTGFRVNIPSGIIPASGSTDPVEIPRINQIDGMSTATQIMTTFDSVPDLADVAYQYNIERSLELDHPTIIWNVDDNHAVAHWVELDARAQPGEQTILHLRTAAALEHDTRYVIVIHGLTDSMGDEIQPSQALQALLDGEITDAEDVESDRKSVV